MNFVFTLHNLGKNPTINEYKLRLVAMKNEQEIYGFVVVVCPEKKITYCAIKCVPAYVNKVNNFISMVNVDINNMNITPLIIDISSNRQIISTYNGFSDESLRSYVVYYKWIEDYNNGYSYWIFKSQFPEELHELFVKAAFVNKNFDKCQHVVTTTNIHHNPMTTNVNDDIDNTNDVVDKNVDIIEDIIEDVVNDVPVISLKLPKSPTYSSILSRSSPKSTTSWADYSSDEEEDENVKEETKEMTEEKNVKEYKKNEEKKNDDVSEKNEKNNDNSIANMSIDTEHISNMMKESVVNKIAERMLETNEIPDDIKARVANIISEKFMSLMIKNVTG